MPAIEANLRRSILHSLTVQKPQLNVPAQRSGFLDIAASIVDSQVSHSIGVSYVAGMPTTKLILTLEGENKVMRVPQLVNSDEPQMSFIELVEKSRVRF